MRLTQLLLKMKSMGVELSDQMLRSLWLDKMPDAVKHILVVSEESLDKLAAKADKIVELNCRQELESVSENKVVDDLNNRAAALELQVSSMSNSRHPRSHNRNSGRERDNSRSKSWKRFKEGGKFYFYDFRFGAKCFPEKRQPPC